MPSMPESKPYVDELGRTDAETYLTDIQDGKIVACRYMKQLANIMLPRFHEEYKRWHFDVEKAIRPVQFIEKFCCFPEGEKMGKPFLLEPYERAAIEMGFGFVNEDGYRQMRQVLMLLARKNGKTSLLAAIMLYMLTSDSPVELGAEVYCCATSESQARKCFGAADAMRLHSPSLAKRLRRGKVQKRGASGLNYDKTGSFLIPLAANLGKLDGLSASGIVYDEMAAATDNGALLDLLEESTSARKQSLTWIITTENYVRDNIFDERLNYSKGWLNGIIHDDTFLPILYTLDSRDEIYNEAMWPKANPGLLCGVKDWQYLRDRVNKAKQSPARMPSLLTKEFNLRSNAYSAYLDIDVCVNEQTFEFSPEEIPYCIVGFDLASRGDLNAAIARFQVPNDDNVYEFAKFWIPEESIKINSAKDFKERDAVPYRLWASQGWLDIVEGDRVNQFVIIEWLRELVDMGIYPFAIGYDPWHVDDYTERELVRLVGESRVFPVPQTARVISPLMKEHKLDLAARRIICPSPVLHWNRASVQARTDLNNNDFPQKRDLQSNHKIDGYMAELFALAVYHKFEEEYQQAISW